MRRLAIITARAGSKGLPDKNMLMVDGKPLLAYSIEAALDSGVFETIVLTTDSEEYIELLGHYPISFHRRPDHLATDKSSSFVAIEDVLQQPQYQGFDYFVLFQPTTPLRTAEHTRSVCAYFEEHLEDFDFLASVSNSHKPTVLTRIIEEDHSMKHFDIDYSNYARQNYPTEYSPNGVFYIAKPHAYLEQKHFYGPKSLAFFMDKKDSIDIDDRDDFEHFYFVIQQRKRQELLLKQSLHEVKVKTPLFSQKADISFVGDAHLGQWDIDDLAGKSIQNIACTSISTQQYLDHIIRPGLLKTLADKVIVSFGINDIRRGIGTPLQISQRIASILNSLRVINPQASIYLLECPPTLFRIDCNNAHIEELNRYILSGKLCDEAGQEAVYTPIALQEGMTNKYGKLTMNLTIDGLNLNEEGYNHLHSAITPYL